MKTNPRPSGRMIEEEIKKAFPLASENIKESQLVRKLKSSLDKITEDDIKIFNFGTGARTKLQFTQFPSVCQNNRQIFDTTKIFKTMSQVDALAHKIGSDFLQYFFIIRKNIPLSRQSLRFVERENEHNFRGQLFLFQQEVKALCDYLNKKIISDVDFDRNIDELIDDFETKKERNIAAEVVDHMLETGELARSKGRIRTRNHREYTLKQSEIHEVK